MTKLSLESLYLFLFSLIPLTIVLGPSVSLINILLIFLTFIFSTGLKDFQSLKKNPIFLILIFLYIYLIFNSLISVDFKEGFLRNFGFIRFIILFLAINYFFYISKKNNYVLITWSVIIFIVVFDSYFENFFGKNILGYGDKYRTANARIVSFFKDEAIVGGYLLGFIFIIIGFYYDKFKAQNVKFKILFFIITTLLLLCVLVTGERANAIKSIIALLIFVYLNQNLSFKIKAIFTTITIILSFLIISNSYYLKVRYYDQFISQFTNSEQGKLYLKQNMYFKIYKSSYEVFKNYPIFGVGNKNYRVVTTKYFENKNFESDENDIYFITTHPHQIYLEFLSEHGIVGTIILLSIFFYLIFKNLKIIILSRNSVQLGCFAFLVVNFLPLIPSGSFFSDFNSNLFWLNLSILYACNAKTNLFNKN